eukprot:TRINITY_DN44794_c0_g1_i1.p1 TRINITY_DN44794_c0_g1~~TRINITY_DN44794_c0_g1_i1.p1  ORF type:complete len:270 (+),score=54.41 TRINITY_DN44794_c0_g1_i1:151-960(+)
MPKECRKEDSASNSKALLTVILLFGTISTAQFFDAWLASSDALLVDCWSMLVDTITYIMNWCAERRSGDALELLASGFSLLVLSAVSVWGLVEGAMDLADPHDEGDVSPGIILAFGIWGVVFDCLSFWGFYKWGLQGLVSGGRSGKYEDLELDEKSAIAQGGEEATGTSRPKAGASMNMRSAFLHVGADFLRSSTTVVEGLFILFGATQGRATDSVASIVVSGTILMGACSAVVPWARQVRKLFVGRLSRPKPPAGAPPVQLGASSTAG